MPRDPVCGAEVPENVEFRVEYKGKIYYFCCEHCMAAFKRNPERYVSKAE
jgi:YHS domain-containing protein